MGETIPVRVRMAPSPTGYLHLGTVRTALFNYLFARKEGGAFVVRIEDTDQERSLPMYEKDILEGLASLGLVWDEGPDIGGAFGPYRQSERLDIYERYLQQLLDEKKAYWCFCLKEDLEEEKKAMLASGLLPKYGGTCRHLTDAEIEAKQKSGLGGVIRLALSGGVAIEFNDIIRGKVSISSDTIGDFIIAKGLRAPLYNFAVVVDDAQMEISHVIRGEDHITNTPKQIVIAKALGFDLPKYAHLPLILAPDRSKLSKRSLETSFNEYIKDGYLPEALLNFLVLLGWHPQDDKELFSLDEMIESFSLKRVQKAGAIFAMDKLDWFNAQYIRLLSSGELIVRLDKFVPKEWTSDKKRFERALAVERERMHTLKDFATNASFFFELQEYEASLLQWKDTMEFSDVRNNLKEIRTILEETPEELFTLEELEKLCMPLADKIGRGMVLWPLRVALCGKRTSPGPFEIMFVLGKHETLQRIDNALALVGQDTLV